MTELTPQVVKNYLAQLELALSGIPSDLATDIRSGIEEELTGLDPVTASQRINELGDPAFIAAEARDAVSPVSTRSTSGDAVRVPLGESSGFVITAALLVAVGGFVIPLAGWVVGIVMVWMSRTWRTWEKWMATLLPPLIILFSVLWSAPRATDTSMLFSVFPVWQALVLLVPTSLIVGIWLLWRARRRTAA